MSATPPNIAMGFNARILIDGVAFGVRQISVDDSTDPHEVGDTEDGQFKKQAAGRRGARISIQIFENTDFAVYTPPLALISGTYHQIYYYPQGVAAAFWQFPFALISQVGHKTDVNNPNDISFTFESIGAYSPPT